MVVMVALVLGELGDVAGEREQERKGVLGDEWRVRPAGVRQHDVACYEFRDGDDRLDPGARRMDPA